MARPKKDNAEYFSHDKDMRNDNRIKAVRRKFKLEGYAVWNMLLEHLTDCDFFEYEYNDLNIELLSGDFDVQPDRLKEMIDYFILLKLLILEDGYIKSVKLIERFEALLKKRKRDRKPTKRELSTPITPKKDIIGSENTQSKVEENKVHKSREEDLKEKELNDFNFKLLDIDVLPVEYLLRKRTVEAVLENRKNKFKNLRHLEQRLFEFTKTLKENGVISKTLADYSSHFRYWHLDRSKKQTEVNQATNIIPIG